MTPRTDAQSLVRHLAGTFPELRLLPRGVFAVGGAVRDAILGRKPVDIDLAGFEAATLAKRFATETAGTFVELGQQRLATFRVVVQGRVYDFNDLVGDAIEADLLRRDFTLNAIALEIARPRLIDVADGVEDLHRKLLRMVHKKNFADDPLRVLKGIRMAVVLDFSIDPPTFQAMQHYASAVSSVTAERINVELDLIFTAEERTRGLVLLNQLQLDQQLFGFVFTPDVIEAVALVSGNDPVVAYAVLFFDRASQLEEFAARCRWSERQRRATAAAIAMAEKARSAPRAHLPVLIYDFGLETARRAIQVLYAFEIELAADALGEVVESSGEQIARVAPLLEGEKIQAVAGIPPGPDVGRLKRAVLEAQLRGEISTPGEAVDLLKKTLRNG